MSPPTLAEKPGTTTHLSPVLHKARRLEWHAEGLERRALARSCEYCQADARRPGGASSL